MKTLIAYLARIFSSDSCASFARWTTVATISTGCWTLIYLVRVNHALPDALALGALAAWMTAPYGINKLAAALRPSTAGETAGE